MSDAPVPSRWRVLLTPRWIGWHLFAVAAVAGMAWLGDWQLHRALAGNTLSWAYTFEWPLFAIFGVFFWVKTVRDELRPAAAGDAAPATPARLPAGAASPGAGDAGDAAPDGAAGQDGAGDDDGQDGGPEAAELAEYNAYLARLHREARSHGRWHGLR